MQDSRSNHFELFNLPTQFAIDLNTLDQHYKELQSEVHPDRFAAAPASERLRSMQLATEANEAYRVLKNPTARARYLLHINGVDTQEESNTAMPAEFLMLQMEWREAIEEASAERDITALETLLRKTQLETKSLQQDLHAHLDENNQLMQAAEAMRKLSFIDKVRGDIQQAIAKLED
ncbi:MAG TPA: Fe-S protein assembly co-chaperone HscB [Methylophilaceae bacterium]|jgi:molecular chaperone HscB